MDRATTSQDEIELLRVLCDDAALLARRLELMQSLRGYVFRDPENQVIFESICFLLPRGGVSAERLTVHLNNRGFPDVDLQKYFFAAHEHGARAEVPDEEADNEKT
jgi:hypothetical protein